MARIQSMHPRSTGFTLVELLVVLAIVSVLAGLLFSVSDGIFDRGNRNRAISELKAISVALEAYRSKFGDYPDVLTARELFDALDGKLGPTGNTLTPAYSPFLEAGNFSLGSEEAPELLDPWDQPYAYRYLEAVDGSRLTSFILFSAGADGEASPDGRGSDSINDDNLWPDG